MRVVSEALVPGTRSLLEAIERLVKPTKISYNFLTVATIWAVMLTKRIWAPKNIKN